MKVAIVGGGTMGRAVVQSILRKRLSVKQDITVSDVSAQSRDHLSKKYGIPVTGDNSQAVTGADAVVLAVKPQELVAVMKQIAGQLKSQLVISIAAGISLESLCRHLEYRLVVRAMPNTPARVGKGMTAWTSTGELSVPQHEMARSILAAMGAEQYFADEKYIDMATAVSGSGPAYVFLFIESLIDAGVHIGLPRSVATKLVIETIVGSAEAMKKMDVHPAELKNMVTSPGGTTAEALLNLEMGGFRSLIINAVTAAYQKAKALDSK
ncbi:MAG: pyrroline-5-carboxylate reductase [Chloroflexi bacterium]|nr:pyrroline-5-carboxylate reductase [Chloroflexota bacterium]